MTDETFKRLYQGDFPAPSKRDIDLHERIARYYAETKELSNRDALPYNKRLHEWWKSRGYTQEEYKSAKRNYEQRVR